ncbi:24704_t:CDS:2 [Cetraspora pellucida]|uniref:24704_t:CDS:1 n=1 Tax=Cetraspora pellucida TaxID=1433469 RepID=A0A9N8Z919_9GLOM|nr:24704_t:CDS:2 [Cetraspora pellucida]
MHLSIEDLVNWLANPKIKNNPTIINKKVPKTDIEWFDLMKESSSKWQKKTKVFQPIEEDSEAEFGSTTQVYRKRQRKDWGKETPTPKIIDQRDESEKDPKDLDKKQKSIQTAKDMFKVDGAEYAFSTWFAEIESKKYEAGMTEERAQEILNAIDNGEFLIRPICESKKAGRKYIRGGPNVILTKKTKPGFWVKIDEKFLVREVSEQSEVERLDTNAVVYGLYQIRKPDVNQLMPIKNSTLNCVAERVIEHFDQAKRGHGLTKIRWQKINDWEKKMHIPGARYRSDKYEEIGMVVHNSYAFPRNQHFPRDRMVEYYKGDTWEAISNALRGPQAIWLIGVGDTSQTISQFVLEDGRTFRTWKKHTEIIEACKQLSLKVVDLAEQVFGTNHAGSRLANEINEWHPISGKVNENIRQACVEHGHGGHWNAPDYHVNDVVCIDMKKCYPASMRDQGECTPWFNRFGHPTHYLVRVAVNEELPEDDITGFAQVGILESVTIGEAIISLTKQTKVWLPRNRDISCAIIDKFTQGGKIDEKHLTHRLVTDEGELDFLIKDCTDAGTFAGREKCLLGFILTYYEGHQPQYTHLRASILAYAYINLLEML